MFCTGLVYDNPKLQTKLVALRARGVKVEVLVDKRSLEETASKYSRGRLETLKAKGAKVYVCSGRSYNVVFGVEGQPGKYHPKVLVVDEEVAFVGSSSPTANSLVNGEVVLEVSGSANVTAKVVKTAWAEAKRVEAF